MKNAIFFGSVSKRNAFLNWTRPSIFDSIVFIFRRRNCRFDKYPNVTRKAISFRISWEIRCKEIWKLNASFFFTLCIFLTLALLIAIFVQMFSSNGLIFSKRTIFFLSGFLVKEAQAKPLIKR